MMSKISARVDTDFANQREGILQLQRSRINSLSIPQNFVKSPGANLTKKVLLSTTKKDWSLGNVQSLFLTLSFIMNSRIISRQKLLFVIFFIHLAIISVLTSQSGNSKKNARLHLRSLMPDTHPPIQRDQNLQRRTSGGLPPPPNSGPPGGTSSPPSGSDLGLGGKKDDSLGGKKDDSLGGKKDDGLGGKKDDGLGGKKDDGLGVKKADGLTGDKDKGPPPSKDLGALPGKESGPPSKSGVPSLKDGGLDISPGGKLSSSASLSSGASVSSIGVTDESESKKKIVVDGDMAKADSDMDMSGSTVITIEVHQSGCSTCCKTCSDEPKKEEPKKEEPKKEPPKKEEPKKELPKKEEPKKEEPKKEKSPTPSPPPEISSGKGAEKPPIPPPEISSGKSGEKPFRPPPKSETPPPAITSPSSDAPPSIKPPPSPSPAPSPAPSPSPPPKTTPSPPPPVTPLGSGHKHIVSVAVCLHGPYDLGIDENFGIYQGLPSMATASITILLWFYNELEDSYPLAK
ncbi:hypothetical protein H4Q26_004904 [Puccinia striiformis f. sp. tritici PST-130]|nr:hypothetical protein H4Q26_004904 [Puccinia striiformis f. sp. tritici PST-130]